MKYPLIIFFILLLSIIASAKEVVKIAVIDTGIKKELDLPLCKFGHKTFVNGTIDDEHGHGSIVTQLINSEIGKEGEKTHCFVIVKVYGYVNDKFRENFVAGIEYVSKLNVQFVNISGGGYGYIHDEFLAIQKLLKKGTYIVSAAGNDHKELNYSKSCVYYPACYTDRIVVVGSKDTASNYGKAIDVMLSGKAPNMFNKQWGGSSMATARATGGLVRVYLKNAK